MKIDIQRITEGEESLVLRYKEATPTINRILGILRDQDNRIWGRIDGESVAVNREDILYLESVDEKVFAYTKDKVLRLDGSLTSFLMETGDDTFFRASKSVVINVNRVISLKSLPSNRIDITMEGDEHLIISRRYASEFRRLLRGEG